LFLGTRVIDRGLEGTMRGLVSVFSVIRRAWFPLAALGVVGLMGLAALAGSARATGSYPGETLSLALQGSAVVGKEANFVASGTQTDVSTYNNGGGYSAFTLVVFAKDPRVDPTCAASYPGERNALIGDPSESYVVTGLGQGTDMTFSVPFKFVPGTTGPVLLCGYSEIYGSDTAASAQLQFDAVSAAGNPTLAERAKAACKAERRKKSKKKFEAKYGHKNAFGKCVSRYEQKHKG
jgi:hypothetical protein